MSDGITITLGEYQSLRHVNQGGVHVTIPCECIGCQRMYHLEHIGLVDIHDDGSVSLTPEGRLTLYPNP